jgi:hypothetical protein
MKTNFLLTFAFVCISFVAFGQDSSFHKFENKVTFKNQTQFHGVAPAQKKYKTDSQVSSKKTSLYGTRKQLAPV